MTMTSSFAFTSSKLVQNSFEIRHFPALFVGIFMMISAPTGCYGNPKHPYGFTEPSGLFDYTNPFDQTYWSEWPVKFKDVFDSNSYYVIQSTDEYRTFLEEYGNDMSDWASQRIKLTSYDHEIIYDLHFLTANKKSHWRFEHIEANKFKMINRGSGNAAHVRNVIHPVLGTEQSFLSGDVAGDVSGAGPYYDPVIKISPSGVEGEWNFRVEMGSGNAKELLRVDENILAVDNSSTLQFKIVPLWKFYPSDISVETSPESYVNYRTTMNDTLRGLAKTLAWALPFGGGLVSYAIGYTWPEDSMDKTLKRLYKAILDAAQELIVDSHADQNVQRANDLVASIRSDFLEAYGKKQYFWLNQDNQADSKIQQALWSQLVSTMDGMLLRLHSAIAENLIDLPYDEYDDITVATARQGAPVLRWAVMEGMAMVADYVAIFSYALEVQDQSDTIGCEELVVYVQDATRYHEFTRYMNEQANMLLRRRDIDWELSSKTDTGFSACSINDL